MDNLGKLDLQLRASLSHAAADLNEALTLVADDASTAAAIASALAFVETAREKVMTVDGPTTKLPRPTIGVAAARKTP